MLDSIRTRLTLWYTGVLAVVIVFLSVVAYFIFWRSAVQRTDANLVELSNSFLVTLRAELEDQTGPDVFRTAAQVATRTVFSSQRKLRGRWRSMNTIFATRSM